MSFLKVLVLTIFLTGCASINSLEPGNGQRIFIKDHSYKEIWRAAVQAVGSSLTIVQTNEKMGVIKAEAPAGMTTWGEVVGVFITEYNDGYYVEANSQKRSKLQITGQNWEKTVLSLIEVNLD